MGVTSQKGAPSAANYVEGRYSLHRIVRCEATAATPVVATELSEIMSLTIDQPTWDFSKKVFHQGGGDKPVNIRRGLTVSGQITCAKGEAIDHMATFFGLTMGSTNTNAIPGYVDTDDPHIIWEMAARDRDNTAHLYSIVIPDMIIDDFGYENPLENSDFTLKWHSYFPWFFVYTGRELVYDVFTGDGSTTAFTLSSTPVNILSNSNFTELYYDNLFYVKEKASGATTGTFKTSGYSAATTTLTATTAPAAGTKVQVLYLKSTS